MKCSVLSSGSKANSTYIETQNTSILIDCGLSCKKCEIALRNIGVDPQKLDAIFVTHSHYDHYSPDDIKKVMKNNTKFVITSDLEDT